MVEQRGERGRFLPGHRGGPGRPSRSTEKRYLAALTRECPLKSWPAICRKAVADATQGDHQARSWLSKYLLGDDPVAVTELVEALSAELERIKHVYPNGVAAGADAFGGGPTKGAAGG
jgi:hypothetical protein